MDQTPPLQLPPALESATRHVRKAARLAAAQAVDSLGLAAMATHQVLQRDALLGAQSELQRKQAVFAQAFDEALDTEVAREAGLLAPTLRPGLTPEALVASWESFTLVDNREVELHISADRLALAIGSSCEWELRELNAYMASLMGLSAADPAHNPLRASLVAQALMRAIDAVSGRPEVRQALAAELGRGLAHTMRGTYAAIVAELRGSGLRPVGMVVRGSRSPRPSQPGSLNNTDARDSQAGSGYPSSQRSTSGSGGMGMHTSAQASGAGGAGSGGGISSGGGGGAASTGTPLGRVSVGVMDLLRQLAKDTASSGSGPQADSPGTSAPAAGDAAATTSANRDKGAAEAPAPMAAPNVIQAHREALRQVAGSALDHLVIDLVAGLFDQILSDTKVPPQFARQIARLQMPVLRAALGDAAFFSARAHPVRRFVNRIASLAAAADGTESGPGVDLLAQVVTLVEAVVHGDFEQAELYEQQLKALDAFVAAQARHELLALGDAQAVLAGKEQELLFQQQKARQWEAALQPLPIPPYLRDFLSQVWCGAVVRAERKEGANSPLAQRLRQIGRDLAMSVQPKGAPAQRQLFLKRLPQLMKDINLGLDHARCPPAARRAFFAQLMPGHAEALKQPPLSTLEHNLLARQVELALASSADPHSASPPPLAAHAQPALKELADDASFSPAEAQQVGLLAEQSVDWTAGVDIDLSLEPELAAVDIQIDGLAPAEAPEPSRGKSLADHVQLGFAYQMHLEGAWQKVRLAHVSPGRGFFVFTHGDKQRRTVSLTHRMLLRLCDGNRLRAFENGYLLERATARARRQLAALIPGRLH